MARKEIARFLEVPQTQVEDLWASGALQRTLSHPQRPTAAFAFSSIYDVLEFALTSGDLPVKLTREQAALWVVTLAEADEWEEFASADWDTQTVLLVRAAQEDGLDLMTEDADLTATVILTTREALYSVCCETELVS